MTYEIYRYIFIGAAVLCGVMFVVAVLLFVLFKIPKVISDLTGATARKAIQSIREQNEASGNKGYKVSAFNEARGKLTDKITPSGNIIQQNRSQMPGINTTKIDTQKLIEEDVTNQTTVLSIDNETTIENSTVSPETTVLSEEISSGETTVLSDNYSDETTVLGEAVNETAFCIEYEITYIHTEEIISKEAIG